MATSTKSNSETNQTVDHSESVRSRLARLFVHNELTYKAPDLVLEEAVRTLFADNPAVIRSLENLPSTTKSRIRVWRSEYNRNLWASTGQASEVFSFRYEKGVPVNRHLHPLTQSQIRESILTHPVDPRKEQYASAPAKPQRKTSGYTLPKRRRNQDQHR